MNLLELQNIGKIYARKGTIAVGIRGVNLSFDFGEFVAITGQSGSGKTSLLNIISGIDSYEEGEMLIEAEPTSHYIREEWEEYREKYISFIFQNYNIIESFTVLENVELTLMDIENLRERRKKAMELIAQVGLAEQANQKASHLSGGQKQRTAIARALAKDSPIILADEPTGNLDSETAADIIRLLKEVSEDKLLIIVTHNFEEVKKYATREIRVHNGAVHVDRKLQEKNPKRDSGERRKEEHIRKRMGKEHIMKKGMTLGWTIFRAKLRLSAFLCFLLTLAGFCVFLFTGIIGKEIKYNTLEENHLFQEEEGRVVVVKRDGKVISDEEVKRLANTYGAARFLHCDILCDSVEFHDWIQFMEEPDNYFVDRGQLPFWIGTGLDFGKPDIGRYPETVSECMLYVPYALSDYFGRDELYVTSIVENKLEYTIVGIKYFTDNNQIGRMVLTEEGYQMNSAMAYVGSYLAGDIVIESPKKETFRSENPVYLSYSFDVEPGRIYVKLDSASEYMNDKNNKAEFQVNLVKCKMKDDSIDYASLDKEHFLSFSEDDICYDETISEHMSAIVVNPYTILNVLEAYIDNNYSQCSLYFYPMENMSIEIDKMNAEGYLAIPSDTLYISDEKTFSEYLTSSVFVLFIWIAVVFFLIIFVSLCTRRIIGVFREDVHIMRSVGVKVQVIQCAVYVRMMIAMVPAIAFTLIAAYFVYRNTFGNRLILYLYPIHYLAIFFGLFLIVFAVTRKQIQILFGTKMKKVMEGDEEA